MKTRSLIIVVLNLLTLSVFGQKHAEINMRKYKPIPSAFRNRDQLIKYVTPDKNYTYWEFDEGEMDTTKSGTIIFSSGTKPDGVVIKDPRGTMFLGCLPGSCYKYIAYVYDGKVGYITNNKDFISFMGRIDNLQEAILLAEISSGLYPDDNKKGGAYLITPTGYQLFLTNYIMCPETKQAIQVDISLKGITKKTYRGVYYKTKKCSII
jgi:hypothetical protein